MKKLSKPLMLLLIPVLLTGCQSIIPKDRRPDASHSHAWNINAASNMNTFYDKDISTILKTRLDSRPYYWGTSKDNNPLNLAVLDLTPLINYKYPAGMGAEEWAFDKMLIWVPETLANTPEQARKVYQKALDEALHKTWAEVQLNKITQMRSSPVNALTYGLVGDSTHVITYFFWDKSTDCNTNRFKNQAKPDSCIFYISGESSTGLVKSPEFINAGSDESYVFNPSFISIDITDNTDPDASEKRNVRALWQKLSNNLPDWMVIYLAPEESKGLPAVILQHGKSYFFVK
ncbi:TPA: hypothetical protein MM072_005376 [Klebsiella pneumoniae]|uniref:hypothetical protein n=1 Tax=Klebsiella pneumoniae TaxID=573 RepID=UPI0029EFB229|nr:hypothetical protein [Klebsiella pneumoniae]HEO1538336.1 hypothetical protein [Klebsiella aerogenes]HBW7283417.1 hypothetical protein [Klebsiella pneumoniae]HBW7975152.1 hypothetical protein [Klebsiella pneumoniae]HBW8672617.1 hypothetical protein [Klebsiella pneumoniae]